MGLTLLQQGPIAHNGLVSELPAFQGIGLPDWTSFVVAGHEIRRAPPLRRIPRGWRAMTALSSRELIEQCREELDSIDHRIRPGTLYNVGSTIASLADIDLPQDATPRRIVARLQADLADFVRTEQLEHVIVVNVASTEPSIAADTLPATWNDMDCLLDDPCCPLPASSLYAIAALGAGHSYINFTPSLGAAAGGIDELARHRGAATTAATARRAKR